MVDIESIAISALNQYAYCPRRCGLIFLEGDFEDNIHTSRGTAEHERVDAVRHEMAEGRRMETALPLWCERIGLVGKADVVEFLVDGTPYPVEYKHGARKKWLNDDLQLAAQALCLEEMTGKPVPKGAIYHHASRRRREVNITETLRHQVEETAAAVRALLESSVLPAPLNDARCRECSLKEICQPEAMAAKAKVHAMRATLFEPDTR
ncbi:MAG: CRISPR-associated protein Cas4 [Sulfurimicrobium sp.]|nr:CRISPR-associated protein Cas4 [Sulfurimicrobium sp.]MDP1703625.1 CRISPR-associated protein Cas4 [Sulfurimicrobium sp.]MDP2199480.1 CRISPR-associated protein Cas4 [Sulfurimicrobium sp.]MDP2962078.1 CRISPR-associated protein Cas4 [Sulfurimicrobium sp.]MDP3687946.1 CRISPR-associated protein Cas4 [Sulfurimicrobium sp.]